MKQGIEERLKNCKKERGKVDLERVDTIDLYSYKSIIKMNEMHKKIFLAKHQLFIEDRKSKKLKQILTEAVEVIKDPKSDDDENEIAWEKIYYSMIYPFKEE